MFPQKTAKEDRSDFVVFHPHPFEKYPNLGYKLDPIPDTGFRCVSIDVGIVNFAVRIEDRYPTGKIEPIYFDKIDFRKYDNVSERTGTCTLNPQILNSSMKYFQDLFPYLKSCRLVVIERQMPFNLKSSKLAQHVLTLFLNNVDRFDHECVITDVNSKLKGKIFKVPPGTSGHGLKAWAIDKALEVLKIRGDQKSIDSILYHRGKSKTKADDLSDTILQLEALIITWGGMSPLIEESLYQPLYL